MEIIVFTVDRTDPNDIYKNAKLYKRGYVVDVHPDGWNWAKDELTLPVFRIFKFPNTTLADWQPYLSWEPATAAQKAANPNVMPEATDNTLQRRLHKLNLDNPSLPKYVSDYIADDTRQQQTLLVGLDMPSIATLTITQPPIPDPALIGTPSNIIG